VKKGRELRNRRKWGFLWLERSMRKKARQKAQEAKNAQNAQKQGGRSIVMSRGLGRREKVTVTGVPEDEGRSVEEITWRGEKKRAEGTWPP